MNRRGLTLIEVLITSVIVAGLALAAARLLKLPLVLQRWAFEANVERQAHTALDRWVKDLKEGVPNSINWDDPASPASLSFAKSRLDAASGETPEPIRIDYAFQAGASGVGTLYRIEGGSRTVFLDQIINPTDDDPLFVREASLHIVMISLKIKPPGQAVLRFVRRVAMVH